MKLQVTLDWILLFLTSYLYFVEYGQTSVIIYQAPNTACPRDHLGHIKCREIDADCFLIKSNEYRCLCSKGYWMFEGRCRKIDWCADGEIGDVTCKSNGTTCKNMNWASESQANLPFKCECETGFSESQICSVWSSYCRQKGAKPYNEGKTTLCECEQKTFFDYNAMTCQNLDLCPFRECKGKYEECQGGECVCKTAYARIGKECRPKNYCLSSKICGSAKCENGPEDDPKSIKCYCDSGYVLDREGGVPQCNLVRCETHSLNPCDHMCHYSEDRKSSYCGCLLGHTLKDDNITCEIQPSHRCSYNKCNAKSICIKLGGTDQCMCKNNLVGKEGKCLDRCAAGLLRNVCPGKCKSTEDSFQCICEGKYKLSKNQVTCEERRMCIEGEEGFLKCSQQNRTCLERPETQDGFICEKCLHGLQEHDGNCTDLCKVEENENYCNERGATCTSVNEVTREVKCKCPPLLSWKNSVGCVFARHSYTGVLRIFNSYYGSQMHNFSDELQYGEGDLDWKKLDHDVGKSMSTLFGPALSGMNVLQCRPDRVDENHEVCITCMIELQLHFKDHGILERLNARIACRDGGNVPEMYCFIPPYLKLVPRNSIVGNVDVPFNKTNSCGFHYGMSVCPASTECHREDVGFSCRCKNGFLPKRTISLNNDKTGIMEICQDINECEVNDERSPCPSGTICVNTIGDYECRCQEGLFRWHNFGDPKTDFCAEACTAVICLHGKCERHERGFYCRCEPGFSGVYCEELDPEYFKRSADNTELGHDVILAVGIVEAVIFVVFIILIVILCRKWRRRGSKDTKRDVSSSGLSKNSEIRNRTIDHIHMRNTPQVNGSSRPHLEEEDADEPIYADCTQVR